jgi:putative transcriptional regulator
VRPQVAELLESAAWVNAALRGEPTEGGRAWRHTPGVEGQPFTLDAVPVAEVVRRVAEAKEAGALAEPDAALIRQQAGLSQAAFAAVLDVPIATLRNWEQGRRAPRGPARQLLRVAAAAPEVLRVLQTAQETAR